METKIFKKPKYELFEVYRRTKIKSCNVLYYVTC